MTKRLPVGVLNSLVLDFLVVNGFDKAATLFTEEAKGPRIDLESIERRRKFHDCIIAGNVEGGIDELNALDAGFLNTQTDELFSLLEMQLIEMIRSAPMDENLTSVEPALEFARERILSFIQEQPSHTQQVYLDKLRRVMALVCFPASQLPPELEELLDLGRRVKLAVDINEAVLRYLYLPETSKLSQLYKVRSWAEQKLSAQESS